MCSSDLHHKDNDHRDLDQDQCVPDSRRDHNDQILDRDNVLVDRDQRKVAQEVPVVLAEDSVAEHLVHIDRNQAAHVRVDLHLVAQDNVLAQVAHLVKVAARRRITRVRRLAAKRSTIWRHQHLVVQSFHAVMVQLQ